MRLSAQKRAGVLIEASVEFLEKSFVVRNKSGFVWKNITLEINPNTNGGGFISKAQELAAKRTYTMGVNEFIRRDGTQYDSLPRPVVTRPQSISIRCDTPMGNGFWFGGFV